MTTNALVDANTKILRAAGFTDDEIQTIAGDPVEITLAINAWPKVKFSRWIDPPASMAPSTKPDLPTLEHVDGRVLPVEVAQKELIHLLATFIDEDKEFAGRVVEALAAGGMFTKPPFVVALDIVAEGAAQYREHHVAATAVLAGIEWDLDDGVTTGEAMDRLVQISKEVGLYDVDLDEGVTAGGDHGCHGSEDPESAPSTVE